MAYNRRKRKIKKNIPEAVAHIHSTYNNTIVTISDKDGNAISWSSAGRIGYKGSKKKTPFAAGLTSEAAAAAAVDAGVKKVDVFVSYGYTAKPSKYLGLRMFNFIQKQNASFDRLKPSNTDILERPEADAPKADGTGTQVKTSGDIW